MAHGVNPIPPLEDRCQQLIVDARLTAHEIRVLWETFQKYDQGSTGTITQGTWIQQYVPYLFYFHFIHKLILCHYLHVLTPFFCWLCISQYKDQFHTIINDEELLFFFGMCLFDLIGARNYKALNFSDFTYACLTLSMFGQEELMRWYVYQPLYQSQTYFWKYHSLCIFN
jgi:hypothetical protein